MKALIIGGGIGGLTAAIALRKAGIDVEVHERAPEIREVGAGISLWANAIRALEQLGVGAELRSRSVPHTRSAILRTDGRPIVETSLAEIAKRFGAAVVVLRRSDLLAMLAQHFEGPVRLGRALTSFEEHAGSVVASFADASHTEADILVGADGLHSTVRAQLHPGETPRYSGYTAWRCITNVEPELMSVSETWGCGRRFGIIPMSGGSAYWYATENAPRGKKQSPDEAKEHLLDVFGNWHSPIPELLQASDAGAILHNDIFDREPAKSWGTGRVTLLGDAAHPMTPNLGQGGCQAIEDALVLARMLSRHNSPTAALRAYEDERVARTTPVVMQSRQVGTIGQMQNAIACRVRNLLFSLMPAGLTLRQLDSVVGYQKHLQD